VNLTPHFTLEELTHSEIGERQGIDNTPNADVQANLVRLARLLEEVRTLLGRPIMVNSAYRCEAINELVGSKPSSQHVLGCAADIKVPGLTPNDVVNLVAKSNLKFDQLIREFDSWTHISIPSISTAPARRQVLIIDKNGTRPF
jgi:hypothetical protein